MKAIIFGGSGFLGSHVADVLTERGYDVVIYDFQESPVLNDKQSMIIGDILDFESVKKALEGCDYVYNFAGVADIEEACADPVKTIESNVLGNTFILEASRLCHVQRFVFASSIYVYSDLASFYRTSKQSCESIIEEYHKAYGLNFSILRYGSLYGPRANEFNFIHKIIKQAIEEGKITRPGDGEEIRDYINVLDAARCSVDILSEEFKNQHIMITGTQSMKVRDLLKMIKEIFKNEINIEYIPDDSIHHYTITPYTFRPRVAKKLVSNYYHDLGQGILDMIYDVFEESSKNGNDIQEISKLIDR